MGEVLKVGVVQYLYKVLLAVLLTPLIYLAHSLIDLYLGKEESRQIIDETDRNW
jgi:uncharacterized PurR-regulated membrane protein YhhQ (DUF165 family)